ncbi:uncharacterized protein KY384_008149 [Bacidia gigantensis]|uniref:uncharacterized protein n=1 Tax=Bacidia gigantensis TaxID=2732470 RepID=UPI001D05648B|nr:uncharacterized protein KY384_008149 [Bacidia gigantensis]KAG8526720.1 hypothetical protein KY384_008149 [Bacidia gigantensis]
MSGVDQSSRDKDQEPAKASASPQSARQGYGAQFLGIPQPIKRVFDRFPLVEYESNPLPGSYTASREKNVLYIFISKLDAGKGRPSYNPGCLKWQAYLRFRGVDFVTEPSNNHASPSGALPFLLPSRSISGTPIPSNRLQRWCNENAPTNDGHGNADHMSLRYEAYMSLLDYRIRNAYLHSLYLCPENFASIAQPLYVDGSTSNMLLRLGLSQRLRQTARSELLKQSSVIDVEALYREAQSAFSAISELLGNDQYFFNEERAGLFDAAVFAYSNILLDEKMQWAERRLVEALAKWPNLVRHRDRILRTYFIAEK